MKKTLFALVLLNLILAAAPVAILLPPIAHTPGLLAFVFLAKRVAPVVSALSAVFAIWMMTRAWRSILVVLSFAVIAATAVFARINYVEWFFPSARGAEMAQIGSFQGIQENDMVIGVSLGGMSRAYPVRYLAFHHMLNDQLGRAALLPTY
jgi:hypothetical protein